MIPKGDRMRIEHRYLDKGMREVPGGKGGNWYYDVNYIYDDLGKLLLVETLINPDKMRKAGGR